MMINAHLVLDERDIEEKFVRSSGPGGQNVNKVATAVELRFDTAGRSSLPEAVRLRLISLAGQRANQDGIIVIRSERYRSQDRNRADARRKLTDLLIRASQRPKKRLATKPSRSSIKRRLDAKSRRSDVKRQRQKLSDLD